MHKGIFVTGTDTGIGKTYVGERILKCLQETGMRTAAMKPVASGASYIQGELQNEDAMRLQAQATVKIPYSLLNPYVYEASIAPHIAAAQTKQTIDIKFIKKQFTQIAQQADFILVEAVGGWRVPLANGVTVADLAIAMQLPVLLVVGLRLGCINHALLTYESMQTQDIKIAGWVANQIDPSFQCMQENIQTLSTYINAPLLGVLDFDGENIDVSMLLS